MGQRVLDARGRTFEAERYRRIVSLVPSWTESLFELGAGERVVGRTDYCVEPRGTVESAIAVGGTKNPRVDQILALAPDLVIANVEENRQPDVERLETAGIPIFVTDAHTVRQAIRELNGLGRLVGAPDIDRITADIEQTWQRSRASTPAKGRPRVFVAIWRDPWMTVNGATFVGDMIRAAGGENVFDTRERRFPLAAELGQEASRTAAGRDTRYPRVSVEEVAARAPEVILLPDEPYRFTEKDANDWREQVEIPAVRNNRIELLDGKLLSWYGVRMGTSLERLRAIIHGDEKSRGPVGG